MAKATELQPHEIKMNDGSGIKICIDEVYNPESISILIGGEAAPENIVTTTISSAYYSQSAKDIFKLVKKAITQNSKKVKGFYVFPSAFARFKNGCRLSQEFEFNRDYDLKID